MISSETIGSPSASETGPRQRVNILIVDDRPDGLLALEAVLSCPQYHLVKAASGKEALARLLETDFAVLLLDVQMPGMDGFELASLIRQRERTRRVPIIFVTAINKDIRYVCRGYESGAVDYIFKPFEPQILRSKVAVFVDLYCKSRQIEEQAARLRASEEWNRALLERARDIVCTITQTGIVSSLSPVFENLTGWKVNDWVGRSFLDLVHPDDQDRVRGALAQSASMQTPLCEARLVTSTDSPLITETSFKWVEASEFAPVHLALIRDISERRQMEEERRRAFELERSNQELEQFAFICSHDLQEPLRQVSTFTQLLSRRFGGKLGLDADEILNHILDGSTRMSQLIRDLLDYSRVSAAGGTFSVIQSQQALNLAVANLRGNLVECGAEICTDDLPSVIANGSQLSRVFQNLIANALKFRSSAAPHIRIQVERRGAEWLFSVKDNGIGFEMCYAERIFTIFKRLHRKEEHPGTGLGLAICRKVIERHGGKIWAESAPGEGSIFFFTLPVAEISRPTRKSFSRTIPPNQAEATPL